MYRVLNRESPLSEVPLYVIGYLVSRRVSDVNPSLSSIVPEHTDCLTPAASKKVGVSILISVAH